MPRYRFRLETLARLRRSQRDTQRTRVAEAQQAAEALRARHAETATEVTSLGAERRAIVVAPRPDVERLLASQRYEAALRARLRAIETDQAALADELERRRLALVEAEREVRTLERLDDLHRSRHNADAARREAAVLDETASQRDWRRRSAVDAFTPDP